MIKLICGKSRAGKTTFAQRYKDVIHLDSYGRPPDSYEKLLPQVAQLTGDITIEGIFDTADLRRRLLDTYQGTGAVCIWIDTPQDVINGRYFRPPTKPHTFEPPQLSEGWSEIITIINYESNNTKRKIGRPGQRHWDKGKAPAAADD